MNRPASPSITLPEALNAICQKHNIVVLAQDDSHLEIAIASPLSSQLESQLLFACGKPIKKQLWSQAQLEKAQKESGNYVSGSLIREETGAVQDTSSTYSQRDESIVEYLEHILLSAIQRRASDIHFEPFADAYRIRLRIDGVLHPLPSPPNDYAPRITTRLKILSQLDIAERRLPQDGQLKIETENHIFSMRIATIPTQYGEKIVLRVQESEQHSPQLKQLGLPENLYREYCQHLAAPQGLILVTGPTGSGKTATLYSGLHYLNHPDRNLCSVEDPIEIPLTGVNQTAVNTKIGLSFSHVLRAFLRQDPDVIMLGEIRDKESAEIAIKAAQTGHLVLSTLHTNSTYETLTRLEQIGIPPYQIISSLKLVIAQRLVRLLCPHCKQQQPSPDISPPGWDGVLHIWQATGCSHCFSGYYGRTGIYEMLSITPELQKAILEKKSAQDIKTIALSGHFIPLFIAGLHLVHQGKTSLQELYRVLGNTP